jgi:hypothetical protein
MRHNTRVAGVGKKEKKKKEEGDWESRKESVLYITFRSDALKMASFCCRETTWRLRVYINQDSDFQRSICWICWEKKPIAWRMIQAPTWSEWAENFCRTDLSLTGSNS